MGRPRDPKITKGVELVEQGYSFVEAARLSGVDRADTIRCACSRRGVVQSEASVIRGRIGKHEGGRNRRGDLLDLSLDALLEYEQHIVAGDEPFMAFRIVLDEMRRRQRGIAA